ncbi:vitamin K epoxide reductase family protein [Fibrella aquatilis]|uniref:Peptidase C39 domain-containing protein n=1 Tax=Fibrella aquatilis TaxID=2817059 RepID=A0A939GBZ6_9BACT|nr:vitamin K epoxide reductase family protein [Fibrella aquatilis]MBO0933603.1 hypothetical protein [Fibrella aquatilis]
MSGQSAIDRNAISALTHLLRLAKVLVTGLTIRERLEEHPDFPALSALCDTLTELNVSNLATKLPAERLTEVPLPALVQLRIGDDELFAPVRQLTGETVEWYNTTSGWQQESFDAFVAHWTGVALLIEPNEQSGEQQYAHNRRRELAQQARVPLMLTGLAVCVGLLLYAVWPTATGPMLGLLALKGLGTVVSGLLIAYSLDATNPALQRFCSFNKQTNCRGILQSSAAKIIGDFGWADVGLLYFTGGFVALSGALLMNSVSILNWLMVLTLLALPYTIWSVYYQAMVARQYCTLCLTVQALFWAELLIGYQFLHLNSLAESALLPVLGTFVGVAVLWVLLRKPLYESRQVRPLRRRLQAVKFSETYLHYALAKQPRQLPYLDGQRVPMIGAVEAQHTLAVISHPMCEVCRIAHKQLETLLERIPNMRVELIVLGSLHPDDRAGQVVKHLITLPDAKVGGALARWFANPQQSISRWVRTVGADPISDESTGQLLLTNHWATRMNVQRTPVLFLNGVELPPVYRLPDVIHLYRAWPFKKTGSLQKDSVEST